MASALTVVAVAHRCPSARLHQASRDRGRVSGLPLGPGKHVTGQVVFELSLEAGGSSA